MTDIIDLFLDEANVEMHMRRFARGREHDLLALQMRMRMQEFIHGPYGGGLMDIFSGTDARLYLQQMNDDFARWLTRARARASHTNPSLWHMPERERAAHAKPLRARERTEIDQRPTIHLFARDDEGCEEGHRDYSCEYSRASSRAMAQGAPFDFQNTRAEDLLIDPHADSGAPQYHLLELDAQMAPLNGERTLPWGYGSTREQLAPKTSRKRFTRTITPSGRVTLDDERELARDIFSRDSRGFILASRR